jgi:hypothetical protein
VVTKGTHERILLPASLLQFEANNETDILRLYYHIYILSEKYGENLLRQMKRTNDTRCSQYMASYRAHDITEFETLCADMGYIRGIE